MLFGCKANSNYWREKIITNSDVPTIKNLQNEYSISNWKNSSLEEIDQEFTERHKAACDHTTIMKDLNYSTRSKNFNTINHKNCPKVENFSQTKISPKTNQPNVSLKVTGHALVSEGISRIHAPRYQSFQSPQIKSTILPVDWPSFPIKEKVKKRPNTVLQALHPSLQVISTNEINNTSNQLRSIKAKQEQITSNQKTPDWAKGVSSNITYGMRRKAQTNVISKAMNNYDFFV